MSSRRRAIVAMAVVAGVVALALVAARSKRPADEQEWMRAE